MKDKPQMIKAAIDTRYFQRYAEVIIPLVKRKFNIDPGIEGSLFSDPNGIDDISILFLSTDEVATEVYDFISSKWQFESVPQLIS